MASLHILNLAHNQLESLPPSIALLVNLVDLDIQNNPALSNLPVEMGDMTLQQLRLTKSSFSYTAKFLNGSTKDRCMYIHILLFSFINHELVQFLKDLQDQVGSEIAKTQIIFLGHGIISY